MELKRIDCTVWFPVMDLIVQENFLPDQMLIPVPQSKPSEIIDKQNKVGEMKMLSIGQWNDGESDKVR